MRELAVLSSRSAYADRDADRGPIVYGKGHYLFDASGRALFDAAGGSGSLIIGHGDQRAVAALAEQAAKLTLFPGRFSSSAVVEAYLSRLTEFAGCGMVRGVLYSSGSDAVEAAIKLALQYHGACGAGTRTKILGRLGSYHGNTLAGLAAGGFLRRRRPYEALLPASRKAAASHCGSCTFQLRPENCAVECAQSLEAAILAEGAETVAAFIAEPVVGAALSGAVPDDRYFPLVRQICDRYGVLLIADEVMSGFGRTGANFAIHHWRTEPDIIVAGKAISGGYFPLSAVLAGNRVAARLEQRGEVFQNGHTHACSPLASAVGLHILDRLDEEDLVGNARQRGAELLAALRATIGEQQVLEIRGIGLMIGVELGGPRGGAASPGLADRLQHLAKERGLLVYGSSGSAVSEAGEHVLLLPPLTIGAADVDFIVERLRLALADLGRTL